MNSTYRKILMQVVSITTVVVHSLSPVRLFATHGLYCSRLPPSFTISWHLFKFMSIELVMLFNHHIFWYPILLPSIFPSIRVFSNESALHIRWLEYWSFSFSISPSNEWSGLIFSFFVFISFFLFSLSFFFFLLYNIILVLPYINMHLPRVYTCSSSWTWFSLLSISITNMIRFSSVQSLSCVRLFTTPWTTACQASLSITNSQSSLKPMSIESMMPSNHLILHYPLLLLPSIFPSIRVFSNESILHIRWLEYWSFSFNISPSNEHAGLISFRMDWLDLLPVQEILKSLLQHYSSKASIL